jgi:predicted amidophosphoribosyltransferase
MATDGDKRTPRRLSREEKTIAAMVVLYCRDHHRTTPAGRDEGLCRQCAALLHYSRARLEKCRYGAEKPTCARCETHCYKPAMRERVREVMRYSGPRMLARHPVLAAAHLLDGRRAPGL